MYVKDVTIIKYDYFITSQLLLKLSLTWVESKSYLISSHSALEM